MLLHVYSHATDIDLTCRSSGGLTDLCHWTRSLTFRVGRSIRKPHMLRHSGSADLQRGDGRSIRKPFENRFQHAVIYRV